LDEVHLLKWPNIVSHAAIDEKRTLAGLGIEHPNEISSVVPTYLERFHRRGQFARYRRLRPPR
jgi:NADH dehydrogenase